MTIDKAIIHINNSSLRAYDSEVADMAIATMRKYQKIVEIVSLNDEEFKQCGLKELKEILEVIADEEKDSATMQ